MAKRPIRRPKPKAKTTEDDHQQIKIEIEKNVPMKRAGQGWAKNLPFNEMEVGDSFELKHDDRWKTIESMMNSLRAAAASYARGGKKFSIRRWSKTSARVWRVK